MTGNNKRKQQSRKNRRPHFPGHLFHLLKLVEENGWDHIISWVNDGKAFRVYEIEEFEKRLLPTYFNSKKYASFTRQLHAYGFNCVRTGRQTGIYSHPSFHRNDPQSSCSLEREVGRLKSSAKISKEKQVRGGAAKTIVDMPLLVENNSSSESDSQEGDSSSSDSATSSTTNTTTTTSKLYKNAATVADQTKKTLLANHPQLRFPFNMNMNGRGSSFWSLSVATSAALMNAYGGGLGNHHAPQMSATNTLLENEKLRQHLLASTDVISRSPAAATTTTTTDFSVREGDFDPRPFPPSHHGFNPNMLNLNKGRTNQN
ncbi:unnamed protein product [Cylindrotheca closterium]|uniref:HSF-type DNA-binding domain-containing protein n=1 Tax=Cylindrotheca closterium TaxID=2856 RepID=A0AAD2PWE3_9STRA|nr:unnamed protein product [Cylindrotheca closterium]